MHELIVIPKIPLEKSKMEIIGVIAMYDIPSKILRFIIHEFLTRDFSNNCLNVSQDYSSYTFKIIKKI
jgi:hypothetical protein